MLFRTKKAMIWLHIHSYLVRKLNPVAQCTSESNHSLFGDSQDAQWQIVLNEGCSTIRCNKLIYYLWVKLERKHFSDNHPSLVSQLCEDGLQLVHWGQQGSSKKQKTQDGIHRGTRCAYLKSVPNLYTCQHVRVVWARVMTSTYTANPDPNTCLVHQG